MFDDNQAAPQSGQTPPNLPIGEPEDLFAQTDTPSLPEIPQAPAAPAVSETPSALDAGILKPIESPQVTTPPYLPRESMQIPPQQNQSGISAAGDTLKEPTMSRGIMTAIIIVVAILFIGGAGWWVYRYINLPDDTTIVPAITDEEVIPPQNTQTDTTPTPEPNLGINPDESDTVVSGTSSTQPVDDTILFGESIDTDGDGLDDARERNLGTDPVKVDTDADELTDGDEVIIWSTNPLNPDTDGDSYLDGNEIKAGFSPKGPGKLFEVRTTTSSTTSTP